MFRKILKICASLTFFLSFIIFFDEFLIYYLTISQCRWPAYNQTNVFVIADTHLLGVFRGHWFDKLKREWQMYCSFQIATTLLQPTAIFFLGDLFDEGLLGSNTIFKSYVNRFNELFYTNKNVTKYVVMGNHDIGYHNEIFFQRINRFTNSFQISNAVDYVIINNNIFIMLNSMALENDKCGLCNEAISKIEKMSKILNCTKNFKKKCVKKLNVNYSRPIIMQHFPLYRESDEVCNESLDLAPSYIRSLKFRENYDCLNNESTNFLIKTLKPRAVFGGHTHYGCKKRWKDFDFWEYTVPSFSWRNNHKASFLLLSISPTEIHVSDCFLPDEFNVIGNYIVAICICFYVIFRNYSFKSNLTKNTLKKIN